MTVIYIIIFIAFVLFILNKIPRKSSLPKNKTPTAALSSTTEQQAYIAAVRAKLAEPPEIIYGIDCLENERITNMEPGRFQTATIERNLYIPKDENNFFYFYEAEGYQIGTTIRCLSHYLELSNENLKNQNRRNGNIVLIETINNGLRNLDYSLLEAAGNLKFDENYKKANKISLKENAFSIVFSTYNVIKIMLKNECLSVKNISTNEFEKTIGCNGVRENHIPTVGGEYFQLFIGDTLVYNKQTVFS